MRQVLPKEYHMEDHLDASEKPRGFDRFPNGHSGILHFKTRAEAEDFTGMVSNDTIQGKKNIQMYGIDLEAPVGKRGGLCVRCFSVEKRWKRYGN